MRCCTPSKHLVTFIKVFVSWSICLLGLVEFLDAGLVSRETAATDAFAAQGGLT